VKILKPKFLYYIIELLELSPNKSILVLFCLFSISIYVFFRFSSIESVTAQATPVVEGTTANVTVSGYLEYINVWCAPVNFTAGEGRQPGREVPKVNACNQGWITINMTENTNVDWNVSMNASDLISVSGNGAPIPPSQMEVWSDCAGGTPLLPTTLDYGLIQICTDIARDASVDVFFNLTIPIAQYNDTYDGDIWIHVNSSLAQPGEGSNRTWYGPDNTTVTIIQYIEFWWNTGTTPIDFATLTPGTSAIATDPSIGPNGGFPSNMTNGDNTNIFIDIYILGTDLECLNDYDACWNSPLLTPPGIYNISIGPNGNLTYSNATSAATWPDIIKFVNYSYQAPPYEGDFENWHHVPNYTDVSSFWNISIPSNAEQGSYGGDITAKAVDEGTAP